MFRDDRIGVLLQDLELYPGGLEPLAKPRPVVTGLNLVEMDRDQLDAER